MASRAGLAAPPQVLIFGPQVLSFDKPAAQQLYAVLGAPAYSWVEKTLDQLPNIWSAATEEVSGLSNSPGRQLLENWRSFLENGSVNGASPLPNTLLTPLVVISHLIQYSQCLERIGEGGLARTESLGLCTGLLSAAAASSSHTQEDLKHYGQVAIRLAMLVGAVVDAYDTNECARSFSIAWHTGLEGKLSEVLKPFPEAYVSVQLDEYRATLTTDHQSGDALERSLRDAGYSLQDVHLRGRFHFEGHRTSFEQLLKFCDANPGYHFRELSDLALPARSNTGIDYIAGPLHRHVLQSMLIERSDWHSSFRNIQTSLDDALVIFFGKERSVPTSLARKYDGRFVQLVDLDISRTNLAETISKFESTIRYQEALAANGIAVVGMSCHLPGANDVDEFWQLLSAGKSQHQEVSSERFTFDTNWRKNDKKQKWYGNFVDNYDTFDHKFFKKSPREMSSTDPQHRLMLQTAYHAVEQSGYFHTDQDKHIGCYIGVGLTDYEHNIACAPANAYSATGNLKSFTAGKISHYFGWTGPGLTIDTACSSSAVAIHSACRAIISGECSAALAGGVNVMSSPEWFQNLAGASFLSPTGQCKPFDAKADGYCRGEGAAAVFLKKFISAVTDGDQILGVIGASMVYQNENCTAITIPNAPSLSLLFGDTMKRAGVQPAQISYVEAHGTGTPVGDPAEYESIRRVLGGSNRASSLFLGSVKGLVGHLESASGVVALVKTLLMINNGTIPPQPSHESMNPSIGASAADHIEISKSIRPWVSSFRGALINNYGASGSNACLVVTQAPECKAKGQNFDAALPFWFCANDEQRLHDYVARIRKFLKPEMPLQDLAFQFSRQSNRGLRQSLIMSCSTTTELDQKLASFEQRTLHASENPEKKKPVILCFGGQVSRSICLDEKIYSRITLFRIELDKCDTVCKSLGLESIYPGVFQRSPIEDVTSLQVMLFATQYACAKTWMRCGIQVAAVVGHSFGELTALCIAGVLTLKDSIRLIAARSQLIKKNWGPDAGAMMAIEGTFGELERLLDCSELANSTIEIACYNGKTSFTLAGPTDEISTAERLVKGYDVRAKRLNVTNAFHSKLVEPLREGLEQLGNSVEFHSPQIPIEHATEFETELLTAKFVADHLRNPVYFHHAVERLAHRYPDCVWLEAGSSSTVTNMIHRALGRLKTSHFQPVNITQDDSMRFLVDATLALWRQGLDITFWPHHRAQTAEYKVVLLPPYQFEKARHWIDWKAPPELNAEVQSGTVFIEKPNELWTYLGSESESTVRFKIHAASAKFQDMVSGHIIAQTAPLCPSTFQLQIATQTLMSIPSLAQDVGLQPQIQGMTSHAPMPIDPARSIWLDATAIDPERHIWEWEMSSNAENIATGTRHASGRIMFCQRTDSLVQNKFTRWERIIRFDRCHDLLHDTDPDEVVKAPNLYKRFSEIVDYGETYRGVRKLVAKGSESAGRVVRKHNNDGWFDTGLGDSFCQVAGMFINMMADRSTSDIYISDRIDQWVRSPALGPDDDWPEVWEVFATHHRTSEKRHVSDVFVFDPRDGKLLEVIVGIHYQLVPKAVLTKALSKFTKSGEITSSKHTTQASTQFKAPKETMETLNPQTSNGSAGTTAGQTEKSEGPDVHTVVKQILVNLSGLEPNEIKDDSDLIELGVDSLMAMELGREIDLAFECNLDTDRFADLTDFRSLVLFVRQTLGFGDEHKTLNNQSPATNGKHDGPPGKINGTITPNGVEPNTSVVEESRQIQYSQIPVDIVLKAFVETKQATDQFIAEQNLATYWDTVLPKTTELCVVHVLDAFDQLGCSIRKARPGDTIERIQHLPKHRQFVDWVYNLLQETARLIDITDAGIVRTTIATPQRSAERLMEDLNRSGPPHTYDYQLTYRTGNKLADCLTGKDEAIQLIFGSPEGREIATGMYGKSPINTAWIVQMESFLRHFISQVPSDAGPIKILEVGAGTGGTSARLIPLLDDLGVAIEYTVTDLSSSLVAAARKRFKPYSFVKVRVFDIEQGAADLLHSQHIVLATNCVHATHNLVDSARNIHNVLRPDGFLLMLEMTLSLPWVDLVFGLIEGWWLFNDGRKHALAPPEVWEKALHAAGYAHVDWSEGQLPESEIQRIIIAHATGIRYARAPVALAALAEPTDLAARQAETEAYVRQFTKSFTGPSSGPHASIPSETVLVTGATGSLGSYLVAHLVQLPKCQRVICMNRPSFLEPYHRQHQALASRGIELEEHEIAKLQVIECDTSKPQLGLSSDEYEQLLNVTAIVHNAWPMSITRGTRGFAAQFQVMQNLIELATRATSRRPCDFKFTFQFISSIATVGMHPTTRSRSRVPEERMSVASVLPTGYGDAKLVCEHMLDATLHKHPDRFRTMVVRIGQITGASDSGLWNPVEHFAFIVKSSQSLKILPDLDGDLSWCPVDTVAATLIDLLVATTTPKPIYHIENPSRQPWRNMISVLASALDIPHGSVVPFDEWVRRVRQFPGAEADNPASKLTAFLSQHFVRMSCGGLVLDTTQAIEHSPTLRRSAPVSDDLVLKYIDVWKKIGFLH